MAIHNSPRKFQYFLFENFDADEECQNPWNPRAFLNSGTDEVLARVAEFPPFSCSYSALCQEFGAPPIDRLIAGGVLRRRGDALVYDTPVFLRQDMAALKALPTGIVPGLAGLLEARKPEIYACMTGIRNGFDVKTNLYHVLCGMILDGSFFDCLSENQVIATSRPHSSGLDYLAVIYEDCPELQAFSNRLLCSYNRFSDQACSLQSFGDANGNRFDFYRFFRLRESRKLPEQYITANQILADCFDANGKSAILHQARLLAQGQSCAPACLRLLELFGYARQGQLCVPVFRPEDQGVIRQVSAIVESCLYDALRDVLLSSQKLLNITATQHQVPCKELGNELYHILFGLLNEELVARGFVSAPAYREGEGRYLQCVEIFPE